MSWKPVGAQFTSYVSHLECVCCRARYGAQKAGYTCPACGPDDGVLDVVYDMDAVARDFALSDLLDNPQTHWRYGPLLPVSAHHVGSEWHVGWTPVSDAPLLAQTCGVRRLRIKDETRNLTGSLKDRASSVGVVRAAEAGAKGIACASTGNAALSLAAYAAMTSMPAYVFVPKQANEGRVAAMLAYGATVLRVDGSYTQAYKLCNAACQEFGWYNRNCAYNPYLVEGKKTCGMEIAEQCMTDPPDWIAVSVGDGCTVSAIAKGLRQMAELELIDWSAHLLGVQAEGVDPVKQAFECGAPGETSGTTIADGIDCPRPRNWRRAIDSVRKSEGAFVSVSDTAIKRAVRDCARLSGVLAEPAGAAAIAGVEQAVERGVIAPNASVLVCVTGSGHKHVGNQPAATGEVIELDARLDAAMLALQSRQG